MKNGKGLSYLHRDQLSPLRTVTDADGALGKRSTYRPFGEITDFNVAPAVAAETKGFIGERYDEDSGLQYLNARYYDPELGLRRGKRSPGAFPDPASHPARLV